MSNGTDARTGRTTTEDAKLEVAITRLEEKVAHAVVLVRHRVTAMAATDEKGRRSLHGVCACAWRSADVAEVDDVVAEHRVHLRPLIEQEVGRPLAYI